eukprot:TRINITY_DN14760_c0_g1_i1.p1 TRINITY_DN14760_c0_g1~~TRINITY_DN14760_c0_g1_i1.p1  ORF type:complete len:254 (-),score=34.15 TRINITY_DN14760_c0_g1_i1:77-838(-)
MYQKGFQMWQEKRPQVEIMVGQQAENLDRFGISTSQFMGAIDKVLIKFVWSLWGSLLLQWAAFAFLVYHQFVGHAFAALCALDILVGPSAACGNGKRYFVRAIKSMASEGSWKGWFVVNISPVGMTLDIASLFGDGITPGVIQLVRWVLNDNAGMIEGACIIWNLATEAGKERSAISFSCCGCSCFSKSVSTGSLRRALVPVRKRVKPGCTEEPSEVRLQVNEQLKTKQTFAAIVGQGCLSIKCIWPITLRLF